MYYKGEGVKQDYFKATEFFKKACDGQNAHGCVNLGVIYENGEGVKQDNKKAKELYGKACDLKLQKGCEGYTKLNKK